HLKQLRDQTGRLEEQVCLKAAVACVPVQLRLAGRDEPPFDFVLQAFGGRQRARRNRLDRWTRSSQQQHKTAPVFPHQEVSVSKNRSRCHGSAPWTAKVNREWPQATEMNCRPSTM